MRAARQKRFAVARGQHAPLGDIGQVQWPGQPFSHMAVGVEHLVAQSVGIERALGTVQVFDALGHAMRRAGAGGADLQHAPVDLHVKGQDVAAQVGEHAAFDEGVPERSGVLGSDLALVGTGETVDGMHRVMADDQLVARVGMAVQHVAQPCRFDMALAAQARPRPYGQRRAADLRAVPSRTGLPVRADRCAADGGASRETPPRSSRRRSCDCWWCSRAESPRGRARPSPVPASAATGP